MNHTNTTTESPARPPEDVAFEHYDFGIGVTVEGADGWCRQSSSNEVTRAVYVNYSEDAPDSATHKLTFTAVVKDGQLDDAWASDQKGQQVGHMPRPKSALRMG